MAVQVHLPVTVRLPPARRLGPAGLADLEVGTGDALVRALDTVREDVLVPRRRERPVRFGAPSVRFASDGDEATRSDVEMAVQRAVDSAVTRSGLRSWYRPGGGPVAALSGPPVARADPGRRGDGTYRIQVFDDGSPGDVM